MFFFGELGRLSPERHRSTVRLKLRCGLAECGVFCGDIGLYLMGGLH